MPKIKIYDTSANEVGQLKLSDDVFNVPYNEALIHEVIVAYLANNRQAKANAGNKAARFHSAGIGDRYQSIPLTT